MTGVSLLDDVLLRFAELSGIDDVICELRDGAEAPRIIVRLLAPTEAHYRAANQINAEFSARSPTSDLLVSVQRRPTKDLTLRDPEIRTFQRALASSLTADRHSEFQDFEKRYIRSGSGAEDQITSTGNHLIFGRRGSGKSTLLVYALQYFTRKRFVCPWVDMQAYEQRNDKGGVVLDVLIEMIRQIGVGEFSQLTRPISEQLVRLKERSEVSESAIRKIVPDIKHLVAQLTERRGRVVLFLDDLHVVNSAMQPFILSVLYSISRGNKMEMKISALEHSTRYWDPVSRIGLEPPGDAQVIHLDYSLTNPERALEHTRQIIDSIAKSCALPSIGTIAGPDAVSRLVWAAAGVARDALNILQIALAGAASAKRKMIAVMDINVATSGCINDKMQHLNMDGGGEHEKLRRLLDSVKAFCIKRQKRNAFLAHVDPSKAEYVLLLKLVDLRFLHILSRGVSLKKAGEKYLALLLDYGFYMGPHKAKTIDVLQETPRQFGYIELRQLPVFELDDKPRIAPAPRKKPRVRRRVR